MYLLTLSHPQQADSACGVPLRSPDSYTEELVRDAILDAFANPVYANSGSQVRGRRSGVTLVRSVVAAEYHTVGADGQLHRHYHVALQASESFRFLPCKRSLLQRHGFASHWSVSHLEYWSAVRSGA